MEKNTHEKIHFALDGDVPELPVNHVGRVRLLNALAAKHGAHYMSKPAAKAAVDAFNSEFEFKRQVYRLRAMGRK